MIESEIYKITVRDWLKLLSIFLETFFLPAFGMETPGVWDVDAGC